MNKPVGFSIPDWTPRSTPSCAVMAGQYFNLVRLDVGQHGDALFRALCGDDSDHNWIYLPYGPFRSKVDFTDWLSSMESLDDPLFHAIVCKATGEAEGLASFLRIEPAVGVIEVGHIHYGNALQQTPAATEAMYLLMHRVFEELGYRRYEWKCDALNAQSRSAAQRLGFTFEGIFRQATIYKGRNRDTAWFSIIDTEWPSIKAAFGNWLAADNFDEAGKQRRSLGRIKHQG